MNVLAVGNRAGLVFRAIVGFSLLALWPAWRVAAAGGNDSVVRKALDAAYARQATAIRKGDVDALFADVDPGFLDKSLKGDVLNVDEEKAAFHQVLGLFKGPVQFTTRIQKLWTKGDLAVVIVDQSFSGRMASLQGSNHLLTESEHSRDTWVRQDSRWKLKRSEELSAHKLVDGRPVRG